MINSFQAMWRFSRIITIGMGIMSIVLCGIIVYGGCAIYYLGFTESGRQESFQRLTARCQAGAETPNRCEALGVNMTWSVN